MVAALLKYRQVFLVGLQSGLVYRWNFAVRSFFSMFHLTVVFLLWGAAFAGAATIGGFSFGQTLTYFLTLTVLQFFIGAFNEDYQISEEIRNGLINQFLLKPINYYLYRFTIFAAARLVSAAMVLVPLGLAILFFGRQLSFHPHAWQIALGLPAMALAALIQFTIAYGFGMLTFWFLEIQGFVILSLAIESILGGQMFPLDLLPAPIFHAAQFTPFFYQMYFPAAILTGRITRDAAASGLILQAAWAVILLGFVQFLWRRGLRRHTAVGG